MDTDATSVASGSAPLHPGASLGGIKSVSGAQKTDSQPAVSSGAPPNPAAALGTDHSPSSAMKSELASVTSGSATLQPEASPGTVQSPPRDASPKKSKKRRIARQGAEQTAPQLREQAKQIGGKIRQSASENLQCNQQSSNEDPVSLDSTSGSASLPSDDVAITRTEDKNHQQTPQYSAPLNDEPMTGLSNPWADDVDDTTKEDAIMDTTGTVTVTTMATPRDDVVLNVTAATDTVPDTEKPTDPFPSHEYF
ncbi:ets DNA-binding protein pokkuri-like [Schistocerca gregaria]|uniref:ets DNA-binding protein pokkuri-like n=1 Tax=Schistocerca gregaria TaxID=7010 RepID=UPI00211DD89E|nr:ets DNA-binding protein pokkuri-like [Schistocerca gregaria]